MANERKILRCAVYARNRWARSNSVMRSAVSPPICVPSVSVQAAALGLPPRSTSASETSYLFEEAAKRGLTPRVLREEKSSTPFCTTASSGAVFDDILNPPFSEPHRARCPLCANCIKGYGVRKCWL